MSHDDGDEDDPGIALRIAKCAEMIGGVPRAASATGVSAQGLRQWISGKRRAPLGRIAKLAAAAGVSLDWVATGRQLYDFVQPFTPIPRYDISPSGVLVEIEGAFTAPLGMRQELLNELGIKPGDAALVVLRGDAMAPTLRDGTLLVIDRGWKTIRGDGIYAFSTGGGFVVRRAQALVDGALQISADNPAYQPQLVPATKAEELKVWGRVALVLTRP